jgi:hypothetical protein
MAVTAGDASSGTSGCAAAGKPVAHVVRRHREAVGACRAPPDRPNGRIAYSNLNDRSWCPISGKTWPLNEVRTTNRFVDDPLEPVAARVGRMFGFDPRLARAVTREVVDALSASVDDYIAQRHDELRRTGLSNEEIFERIQRELPELRFTAPALSERQIRRRIYG